MFSDEELRLLKKAASSSLRKSRAERSKFVSNSKSFGRKLERSLRRKRLEIDFAGKALASKLTTNAGRELPDPNSESVYFFSNSDLGYWLALDSAVYVAGRLLVNGWTTCFDEIAIGLNGKEVPSEVLRYVRPDVEEAMGFRPGRPYGFSIRVIVDEPASASLNIGKVKKDVYQLKSVGGVEKHALLRDSDRIWLAEALPAFSPDWVQLIAGVPGERTYTSGLKANIEFTTAPPEKGFGLVSGWLLDGGSEYLTWLEVDGHLVSIEEAIRRERIDVAQVFPEDASDNPRPGFILSNSEVSEGAIIKLNALVGDRIEELCRASFTGFAPTKKNFAEAVFSLIEIGDSEFEHFCQQVAGPLLNQYQTLDLLERNSATVVVTDFGRHNSPSNVETSVIVPLYGKLNFIEHQLLEFSTDDWFKTNAEIIYVLDDPNLLEEAMRVIPDLCKFYGFNVKLVHNGRNCGFSSANNLGASVASGRKLLFLNSDVFPITPGWGFDLEKSLDSDDALKVVAPKLVFGDGSIQHAGMSFEWSDRYGTWLNHHPYMGLDPALDPHSTLTSEVQAVTGACLLIERETFDQIGGWDESYFLGDFEDSDLCMKVREIGGKVAYNPTIVLTHLERQSFALIGGGSFRQKLTIYNALQHAKKWDQKIRSLN